MRKAAAPINPKRRIATHPANSLNNLRMSPDHILIPDRLMMGDAIAEAPNGIEPAMDVFAPHRSTVF